MKKSILEIYGLLVCFVTLCCFVISLGIGLYDAIEIINPEFTISEYEFEKHQTNDAYLESISKCDETVNNLTEDEIKEKRNQSYTLELKSEQREGLQSLIQVLIIMLIDVVVFLIHWMISKRARAANMI